MKTKNIYIALVALFLLAAVVFSGIFFHQYNDGKESQEAFNELESMISEPIDDEIAEALEAMAKYQALYEQNEDFVGWIKIENTLISYPVMQSIDNPDFYLKHAFDRSYSNYGVPYVDEACATGLSNNIIIYGHNMSNSSMFADLLKYASQDYYEAHPLICFDTISRLSQYQIVAVFRFDTNNETFHFNEFTDMNEEEFAEYMTN